MKKITVSVEVLKSRVLAVALSGKTKELVRLEALSLIRSVGCPHSSNKLLSVSKIKYVDIDQYGDYASFTVELHGPDHIIDKCLDGVMKVEGISDRNRASKIYNCRSI